MPSCKAHAEIIEEYLTNEIKEGRILDLFLPHTIPHIHINRFGVIPKRHQPGKWQLITDLSFPEGNSVNDAISAAACTLQYISVDQVALQAMQLGKGALLAKTDIKAAYRIVPVAPQDRIFLGMKFNELVYVDGALPFGLRSAPCGVSCMYCYCYYYCY